MEEKGIIDIREHFALIDNIIIIIIVITQYSILSVFTINALSTSLFMIPL